MVLNTTAYAQELEPHALTNLPVGTNFVVAGYGFASGNVLMDPSLPLEDLDAKMHSFFAAYVRSFNFFGLSAKVDAILPYATGDWYYTYQGNDEYDLSNGFGDARFRLSINFIGAPALKKEAYKDYKPKTIFGYSIQVFVPTGNYKSEQLPNLGSNRWTFKNQLGISHTFNKWIVEGYAAVWLFTANNNFLNGNKLNQDPLFTLKAHVIRSLPKRFWVALGVGYGYGGRSYVFGVRASKIKAWNGSELIVPNGMLISNKVNNWTLSDEKRRLEINISTNTDVNPKEVIELLTTVAKKHQNTLENPAPMAIFNGYGTSSLDFTLYCWVDFSDSLKTKSEVALNAHATLVDAGITVPVPYHRVDIGKGKKQFNAKLLKRDRSFLIGINNLI